METYRIMILDSDLAHLDRLSRLLQRNARFQVVGTLSDGRGALEAIRSQQPDAVLMNLLLPNVDGLTLIRELRKTDARLVLVCMSEFFSPTSIELMRRYQVDYFLFKPFAPQTAEIVLLDCLTVSEELRTMAREGLSEESEEKLEARIRQALRELNFSSRYVGFEHLTRAVAMAYEAPDCLRNLTAGLSIRRSRGARERPRPASSAPFALPSPRRIPISRSPADSSARPPTRTAFSTC